MKNLDTAAYVRELCERVGGQRAAARLLHVDERTVRRWVAGDRQTPWMACELLRRMIAAGEV